MKPSYFALGLAACALCSHCAGNDENEWEGEGRVYATFDLTVARAAKSEADGFPPAEGDVVYAVSFEVTPGAVPPDARDAQAFVQLPGVPLEPGDEPVACAITPVDEANERVSCGAVDTGEGPNGHDLVTGERRFNPWEPVGLSTEGGRRVVLEVRRGADAPSLEGVRWKVYFADAGCQTAIRAVTDDPTCTDGAVCSKGALDYHVDAKVCRWRNK
jgi:hypothetical protein